MAVNPSLSNFTSSGFCQYYNSSVPTVWLLFSIGPNWQRGPTLEPPLLPANRPKWQPGPTLEPPLLPCCGSAQCRTPNTPPLKNAGEGREATHAQKFPRFSPLAAHQHHPERLAVGAEEVRSRRCITNPSAPPFQLGFLCSRKISDLVPSFC